MSKANTTVERLRAVHGDGPCHICGKPKAEPVLSMCSYPHGRLPVEPVDPGHPNGFWGWEMSKPETTERRWWELPSRGETIFVLAVFSLIAFAWWASIHFDLVIVTVREGNNV